MNVLDLRGPEFLELYAALLASAVVAAFVLRWLLRGPGGDVPSFAKNLDPYEVAYLAGGARGAVDSAIAALVQRGVVKVWAANLKPSGDLLGHPAAMERVVFAHLEPGGSRVSDVRKAARPFALQLGNRLQAMGVVLSAAQKAWVQAIPALLVAALLMLGIAKIAIGISRNRPVGFLMLLSLLTFAIALLFATIPAVRTRSGDRLLRALRNGNAALRTSATHASQSLASTDVAVALALFGPAILASGPLASLRDAFRPPASGGSGCGGGSGCAGASCGGGCGGGGCGGCGGG